MSNVKIGLFAVVWVAVVIAVVVLLFALVPGGMTLG
jgi:hypothetical protein